MGISKLLKYKAKLLNKPAHIANFGKSIYLFATDFKLPLLKLILVCWFCNFFRIYRGVTRAENILPIINPNAPFLKSEKRSWPLTKENDFKISYEKATKYLNSGNVFQHLEKIQSN